MPAPEARSPWPEMRTAGVLVFLVALVFRLAAVHLLGMTPVRDLLWNDAVGWNLAQGHGFTASHNGYVPGIFRTPAYPAFLSVVYRIFGHDYHAAFWAQSLVDSLTAVLVLMIARRFLSRAAAILAGLLYATYPYAAVYCGFLSQDVLLTFTVTATVVLLIRAQDEPDYWPLWLWCGVAVGFAALVKNFLLLLVLLVGAVILTTKNIRQKAKACSWAALGLALVISPWVVRNYLWFHSFPPLAVAGSGTNLVQLVEALDHDDYYAIRRAEARAGKVDADYLDRFVDGQALIAQEKALSAQALPELARRWPKYLLLIVRHVGRLWVTTHTLGHSRLFNLAAFLVSWVYLVPGLVGMYLLRAQWRAFNVLYGLLVLITLSYSPYTVEARYTLPARPVMMVFIAVALIAAFEKLHHPRVRAAATGERA